MLKKKGWRYKKCVIKQKPKIQDYNNCLKAARKGRTKNYLEKKIRINIDSIKGDQKELAKQIQQRFKSERHNVFTKVTNRIALS